MSSVWISGFLNDSMAVTRTVIHCDCWKNYLIIIQVPPITLIIASSPGKTVTISAVVFMSSEDTQPNWSKECFSFLLKKEFK